VTVEPSGDSFVVHPGENLLAAGRRAGVWLPFECGWGSCGTCKATLVSGEVELLFPDAPAIDPRDERRRRILTCQTTTATDVTLKVNRLGPFNERPTTDHMGTLVTRRELAPGIDSFTFKLPDRADFRPGQYAILGLGPDLRRCYSMDGFAGDEVTFVAKHYPGRAGSSALHALELGAQVPISLPFGDMWVRDDDSDAVLIAGGTGVAPILAVLREMHRQGRTHRVTVLYGANTPAELVCLDELAAAVGELPDAELIPVVQAADAEWSGRRGLATTPLEKIVGPEHRCYLAGPPPMVDAVITVLKDRGVRMDHVHYDRFG
jgi:toluene monooxygenase electron transfer component